MAGGWAGQGGWAQGAPAQQGGWAQGAPAQQGGWAQGAPAQQGGWAQGAPAQQGGWAQQGAAAQQQQGGWGEQQGGWAEGQQHQDGGGAVQQTEQSVQAGGRMMPGPGLVQELQQRLAKDRKEGALLPQGERAVAQQGQQWRPQGALVPQGDRSVTVVSSDRSLVVPRELYNFGNQVAVSQLQQISASQGLAFIQPEPAGILTPREHFEICHASGKKRSAESLYQVMTIHGPAWECLPDQRCKNDTCQPRSILPPDGSAGDGSALVRFDPYGGAPDPAQQAMVDRVKAGQRSDEAWKKRWEEWCGRNGGNRDPARRSVAEITQCFAEIGDPPKGVPGQQRTVRRDDGRRGKDKSKGPKTPEHQALIATVKKNQKAQYKWAKAWEQYADEEGGGTRDPGQHSEEFLRDAIRRVDRVWQEIPDPRDGSKDSKWIARRR